MKTRRQRTRLHENVKTNTKLTYLSAEYCTPTGKNTK